MKFTIPLQTEVSKYIREKKGWPMAFCDHYAEKFWNHYQASGWKLSSGNAIKDWKACFNAQWQTLKFKEDIDMLNQMMGVRAPGTFHKVNGSKPEAKDEIERLDQFIDTYRRDPLRLPFEKFGQWYDFMKANKLLRPLTQDDVQYFLAVYQGDKYKCRCAVVQETLNGYINNDLRVSDLIKARL